MKKFNLRTTLYLFAFILLNLQWPQSFQNAFHIIDDHQIVHFSTMSEKVTFNDMLMQTEVGKYGNTKRFRPSYYTIRMFEISTWLTNVEYWNITRIFIYSIFSFVCLYLLKNMLWKTTSNPASVIMLHLDRLIYIMSRF